MFSVSSNPTPGILINRPNGTDVYKGVPKDYTGDVSASAQIFVQECKSELLNKLSLNIQAACFEESLMCKANFLFSDRVFSRRM